MKKTLPAVMLSVLLGVTSCTENYQSSIDFGDNTYVNDYSELAKAINDLSKSLDELQRHHALLTNILGYSDGIIFNGAPDANQQYASINVTTSVWHDALKEPKIMAIINNLLAPQGAPTPTPTQYVSSSRDYSENKIHEHSVWTRVQDNNVPQFGISWRLVICEDSVTNPLPVPLSTGYI